MRFPKSLPFIWPSHPQKSWYRVFGKERKTTNVIGINCFNQTNQICYDRPGHSSLSVGDVWREILACCLLCLNLLLYFISHFFCIVACILRPFITCCCLIVCRRYDNSVSLCVWIFSDSSSDEPQLSPHKECNSFQSHNTKRNVVRLEKPSVLLFLFTF